VVKVFTVATQQPQGLERERLSLLNPAWCSSDVILKPFANGEPKSVSMRPGMCTPTHRSRLVSPHEG
jgi:hypothetical protein